MVGTGLEAGLVPGQEGDAGEADDEAEHAQRRQALAQPDEGDNGRPQRRRRIDDAGQARRDGQSCEGEQCERNGAVQGTDEQQSLPVRAQLGQLAAGSQQRDQHGAGQADAHGGQRDGTELVRTQAHEEEGGAPQRRQQDQLAEIESLHAAALSKPNKAFLRSMPPA
jgi:hypothetical protein